MSKKSITPSVEEMFEAGVHFGHKSRHWHPKMEKFIHSSFKGVHIIDLVKTQSQLKEAQEFLTKVATIGKRVIFVGTKDQAKEIVKNEAKNCGGLYVIQRWFGGTLTNFDEIKKNIDKMVNLKKQMDEGTFNKNTKKERLLIQREIEKLEMQYGGLVGLNDLPGAVVVVDAKREKTAIRECRQTGVPVIAITDTNTNPLGIEYVIPANDDAIKSVAMLVRSLSQAVEEGYNKVKSEKK